MDAGDEFRRNAGRGDAVALLGMGRARDIRERLSKGDQIMGRAFVFNSLKHPEEVDVLRNVYGQAFFLISVYESRENRLKNLGDKSAKTSGKYDPGPFQQAALELIGRDQKDRVDDLGQNVRDTFPRADLFLNVVDGFDQREMSDDAQWLRRQLSSASNEVGKWDPQKRDTLRSEVSTRLRGSRSERSEAGDATRAACDPKTPEG
jgi:hypothetical protein